MTEAAGADPGATPRRRGWRTIAPVPANVATPKFTHSHYGAAAEVHEYRVDGELWGYVCGYRDSAGETQYLPYTWCEDLSDDRGTRRWHFKLWHAPRPLYLAAPDGVLSESQLKPTVVVGSERHARAGQELLGLYFDFVTWPGAADQWAAASWEWLTGRSVYVWPDRDNRREALTERQREAGMEPQEAPLKPRHKQPGMKAANGLATLLWTQMGCKVRMVPPEDPGGTRMGYGLADMAAEGATPDEIDQLIRSAIDWEPKDAAPRAAGTIVAHTQTPSSAGAGSDAWRSKLLMNAKGDAVLAKRENVAIALDGWPEIGLAGIEECRGLIAFNEFTNNIDKLRPSPWGTPAGAWQEDDELRMGDWLTRIHGMPSMSRETLIEGVQIVAGRNSYHPVRRQFEALRGKWDGKPRAKHWLKRVFLKDGAPPDADLEQYLARAGTWFLMAMVCRVLPKAMDGYRIKRGAGTKFDYMLILESPQGWGKSTIASMLGGEYFADTGLILGDKDSYQNIQGKLLYEWGELENMSKQEVSKVKLFISSPKDTFRASFDRRPRDYHRQVVFIGTTNEANYLTDVTGNRRFWPVRVTRPPDLAWMAANLDQLLAEALHRLDADERFWPTLEEQKALFDPQQKLRTLPSGIEDAVREFLYDEDQKVPHGGENGTLLHQVTLNQLMQRIGFTTEKQTAVVRKQASAVMHALGWTIKRSSSEGRPWVYVRPKRAEDEPAQGSGPAPANDGRPTQGDDQGDPDGCPF